MWQKSNVCPADTAEGIVGVNIEIVPRIKKEPHSSVHNLFSGLCCYERVLKKEIVAFMFLYACVHLGMHKYTIRLRREE